MCRPWTWTVTASMLVGCGADETLSPPSGPEPSSEERLDICGAVWSLLQAPGVAERVCALRLDRSSGASVAQCKLCTASLSVFEDVLSGPTCHAEVSECAVTDAELHGCFRTIGEILTQSIAGCEPNAETHSRSPTELALTLATSECGPVLTQCQPAQQLVAALIGVAL